MDVRKELADYIFPSIHETIEDLEKDIQKENFQKAPR